jgi:glycogen debranching enzyme
MDIDESRKLWDIGMKAIQALEADRGILASGKEELYGCIFGRDSLLTSLLLLSVYEKTSDGYLLSLVRKVLVNLAKLQGREVNRQSGEEPGKIIHEFRPENHEHLTQNLEHPWYLYPDNVMRSYDTVDATPLFLIALEQYQRLSKDAEILELLKANAADALKWIMKNIDESPHGFVSYGIPADRTFGGLSVQSWMDSGESLFYEEENGSDKISERPPYPIAPVEVQAYAYKALSLWGQQEYAKTLKLKFANSFILPNGEIANAVDGKNRPLTATRSSIGHCLWAGWKSEEGAFESILPTAKIPEVIKRIMEPDMFVPGAGIRTLSALSTRFDANSYHNGSIWPHDTALIAEGIARAGYEHEAHKIREALLTAYEHFQTPIELFKYDDQGIGEYMSDSGQGACRLQAWSAAGLLATIAASNLIPTRA